MQEKKEVHDKRKIAIENLSRIICKTMKNNGECVVIDFVHDLANVAMFSDQIMATQIDKMKDEIDCKFIKIGSDITSLENAMDRIFKDLSELKKLVHELKRGV